MRCEYDYWNGFERIWFVCWLYPVDPMRTLNSCLVVSTCNQCCWRILGYLSHSIEGWVKRGESKKYTCLLECMRLLYVSMGRLHLLLVSLACNRLRFFRRDVSSSKFIVLRIKMWDFLFSVDRRFLQDDLTIDNKEISLVTHKNDTKSIELNIYDSFQK